MSHSTASASLTAFLSRATQKAAEDLSAAFDRIPEDKQAWSPMGGARSAIDQLAEVAMLNGSTADMLASRSWPAEYDMNQYVVEKAEWVAKGAAEIKALLTQNTDRAVAAIEAVSESDFDSSIDMPWGPMTLQQIMSYPYWNACYHEGQINYIASMLGCLE